jgi:hypothetical protein
VCRGIASRALKSDIHSWYQDMQLSSGMQRKWSSAIQLPSFMMTKPAEFRMRGWFRSS